MSSNQTTIAEWSRQTQAAAARVAETVARDLAGKIRAATPVDTGRARAGWRVAVNRPASGEGAEIVDGQASASAGQNGARDFSIFITNDVPYIRALEYGRGGVAPAAMVRGAVNEFAGVAARAVADVKKGGGR